MYRRNYSYRNRSRFLLATLSTLLFRSSSGFPNSIPSFILSKNVRASACGLKGTGALHSDSQYCSVSHPVLRRSFIMMASDGTEKNIPESIPMTESTSTIAATSSVSASVVEEIDNSNNSNNSNIDKNDKNTIDKSLFDQNIRLVAINIPAQLCTDYMKTFKDFLLKRPRMKRIFDAEKDGVKDESRRLILLSEDNGDDLFLSKIPEELKVFNNKHGGLPEVYVLKISYEHVAVDEVLRKVLPENVLEIPSSFEQVGHIAHLNLREEVLQYKYLIGNVILDKNSNIRTVVNKVGSIETEFRTFPMEVIAGDVDFNVHLRESNAKFNFNFKDVYWNSRLQMEHSRMIGFIGQSNIVGGGDSGDNGEKIEDGVENKIENSGNSDKNEENDGKNNKNKNNKKGPNNKNTSNNGNHNNNKNTTTPTTPIIKKNIVVADMMAGVGPFAVPLAINNIKVYANDLNPSSYKYLNTNMRINHCDNYLKTFNMCGRDFILSMVQQGTLFNEVLMNLPQSATDFLDVFIGLAKRVDKEGKSVFTEATLPRIHVYAFSTAEDPILDIVKRSAGIMQCDYTLMGYEAAVLTPQASNREIKTNNGKQSAKSIKGKEQSMEGNRCWGHIVRDVSPKKMMVCLSFRLPVEVANAEPLVFVPYVSGNNEEKNTESSTDDSRKSVKRDVEGVPKSA